MRSDEFLKKRNGFLKKKTPLSKFITTHLNRYAFNLLGKLNLTEESLTFFFFLFNPHKLITIQSEVNKLLPSNEKEQGFNNKNSIPWLIRRIEELPQDYSPKVCQTYENMIIEILQKNWVKSRRNGSDYPKQLITLSNTLDFTKIETEIVLFHFILSSNRELADLFSGFEGTDSFQFLAEAINMPLQEVRKSLDADGKLLKMQVLELGTSHGRYGAHQELELSEVVVNFLSGLDSSAMRRDLLTEDRQQTFPLDDFTLPAYSSEIFSGLIWCEGACNILLYGNPGTGKTELARSIIRSTGKRCYFLNNNRFSEKRRRIAEDQSRALLLQLAVNIIEDNQAVLVVDEADNLLNTVNFFSLIFGKGRAGEGDKGFINTIMDSHDKKIIWITNSIRRIEDSTLRRFHYSLHFKQNSITQRIRYWENLVKKHELSCRIDSSTIKKFAEAYKINAGHIGKALETYAALSSSRSGIEELEEILDRQDELIHYGRRQNIRSYKPQTHFDLRFLNTDITVDRVLQGVATKEEPEDAVSGTTILLYGPPGTGKSEFARYIARRMQKEFLLKRSSDILSPWVGENEHNIRDAFDEAENEGAVLCIDEADSFFRNRQSVRGSWEVSFTNELLTQMESFSGVFICSTNIVDILDPAVMRRFAWKIKFYPLKKEHRIKITHHYFSLPELSPKEQKAFADISDLTPGDVFAVFRKYGRTPHLSPTELAQELARETSFRKDSGRQIGFTSSW